MPHLLGGEIDWGWKGISPLNAGAGGAGCENCMSLPRVSVYQKMKKNLHYPYRVFIDWREVAARVLDRSVDRKRSLLMVYDEWFSRSF